MADIVRERTVIWNGTLWMFLVWERENSYRRSEDFERLDTKSKAEI